MGFDSFLSFLAAGGPIMYPLSIIGVLVITLGIHQVFWLFVWTFKSRKFSCTGAPMWAAKAINMARNKVGFSGLSLLESIEMCFFRIDGCLTRRIPALRFLAQISTLMGFLGTVTGMVKVFNTVAKLGVVTPADLAAGIHEALFTTVYGLVLAIIAWGFTWIIETLAGQHMRVLELAVIQELEQTSACNEKLPPKD